MSALRRVLLLCALANLGGGACMGGCCGSAETANYEQSVRTSRMHEMETFVYERPIADAWPEVIRVLGEFGYALAEKTPVDGKTLETGFKPASYGDYRVLVRVVRLDAVKYRLMFDLQYRHLEEDGGATYSIEDKKAGEMQATEIAWRIAQRVEPQRTLDLEKRTQEKAERAAAVGRGCDRGCAACASLVPEPKKDGR